MGKQFIGTALLRFPYLIGQNGKNSDLETSQLGIFKKNIYATFYSCFFYSTSLW